MKSKEALIRLYIMADTPEQAIGLGECYDIVEKDLEVLEILKPRILLKDSTLDVMEVAFIEARGFVFKNSNEYRLLKEWLNDNKE